MSAKSKIEWTDATWNPVTGCTEISMGCRNCYAKRMANRLQGRCGYPRGPASGDQDGDPFRVTLHADKLDEPLRWKKPRRVFVCSMGDLFHDDVPADYIDKVFDRMLDSDHTYMVLTKRPRRMAAWITGMLYPALTEKVLERIWLGTTCENQSAADERIPWLLKCPAVVRFVSCEPLLGPVDIGKWLYSDDDRSRMDAQYISGFSTAKVNWVIAGGETGPKARPAELDWFRSLRDQCEDTPFFFKGTGTAGRQYGSMELDGCEHKEFPDA